MIPDGVDLGQEFPFFHGTFHEVARFAARDWILDGVASVAVNTVNAVQRWTVMAIPTVFARFQDYCKIIHQGDGHTNLPPSWLWFEVAPTILQVVLATRTSNWCILGLFFLFGVCCLHGWVDQRVGWDRINVLGRTLFELCVMMDILHAWGRHG